mgnify:CR=1 FL=1
MHPILFRIPLPGWLFGGGSVPIYAYGVMLGLSFVVGWYLTLGLAEREGLPKETMANCYVVTALSAVVFARLLYVVTNLHEFNTFADVFNLRTGGMVAYGGFLGGLIGSFGYLAWKKLPLIPWADVAVPSLASGLLITRIGCYLYGCDFGRPLSDNAPALLKKLGTFPKWAEGTLPEGAGSPAWAQHVRERGLSIDAAQSLPVHPTQIYEALLGASLLAILLLMRKHQRFRGQIFLSFTLMYGAARFCLELIRDDLERGNIPPALAPHILFPICLAMFAAAYTFGVAPAVTNKGIRLLSQVASFVPMMIAFITLSPAPFQPILPVQLSTSQFIGLSTGVAAAIAFAMLYRASLANPKAAMALPDFAALLGEVEVEAEPEPAAAPKPKKKAAKTASAEEIETADAAIDPEQPAIVPRKPTGTKPKKRKSKTAATEATEPKPAPVAPSSDDES